MKWLFFLILLILVFFLVFRLIVLRAKRAKNNPNARVPSQRDMTFAIFINLGTVIGVMVGMAFMNIYGIKSIILGVCLGALLGFIGGIVFRKK